MPALGVPIKRPKKTDRPIVIAPIQNRIVQRSILEVLQTQPSIQKYILVPTSYGGVKDPSNSKRVQDAVFKAYEESIKDKVWYIRSDIREFFTKIDRQKVINTISQLISDDKFMELLESALTTELSNLEELGHKAEIFPIHEIGVAQGCCLSPLAGNILLHDFDIQMNQRGIICLRYIDDILILGKKKEHVIKAFKTAQDLLNKLKLTAYDPDCDSAKAALGKTSDGFEFLGCHITHAGIYPSIKSRKNLIYKIEELFRLSGQSMRNPKLLQRQRMSLADTLKSTSNIIEGWGNQYSFCNSTSIFDEMDKEIDVLIKKYLGIYSQRRKKNCAVIDQRRLLGIQPLADCYMNPRIILPEA